VKRLLTFNNRKTLKSVKAGYLTAILELAPATLSGYQVCPKSTPGCLKSCIFTSGFGRFDSVQQARIERTKYYFNDRKNFILQLEAELVIAYMEARSQGLKMAARINGMSDIPTLAIEMANRIKEIEFYDYTKRINTLRKPLPDNYHLTFSRSEDNEKECLEAIERGFNVSVVFPKKTMENLPERFFGLPVIEGDSTDLRLLDPKNHVIALSAKGQGQTDTTGFVHRG
jgi:hypothetical protein